MGDVEEENGNMAWATGIYEWDPPSGQGGNGGILHGGNGVEGGIIAGSQIARSLRQAHGLEKHIPATRK